MQFYVIAEEKSFTKAADRLNTSQPALSIKIGDFEDRIKKRVFDRSNSGVSLTAHGKILFEHAKHIFNINNMFSKNFLEDDTKIEGEISIVAFPYIGNTWVMPALKGFFELYPNIDVVVHMNSDDVNPLNYDVGIGSYIPNQSYLIQEELFKTRTNFFASQEYLEKKGTPKIPSDLDNHDLITYKGEQSYSSMRSINMLLQVGRYSTSIPRHPHIEVDSLSGMVTAALQGFGIAELPSYNSILSLPLKKVLPNIKGDNIPLCYIYHEKRKNSKKIQALYKYLKEVFDNNIYLP
jgi:DNA-binding transcriptional LysR family regulator